MQYLLKLNIHIAYDPTIPPNYIPNRNVYKCVHMCSPKTLSQTENNPNVLHCCWSLRSITAQNCIEVNLPVASLSEWERSPWTSIPASPSPNLQIILGSIMCPISITHLYIGVSFLTVSLSPLHHSCLLGSSPPINYCIQVFSQGSPNFHDTILLHLHIVQRQTKSIYGDRSQNSGYLVL